MFAVLGRGEARFLFEDAAEVGRVVHMDVVGDFLAAKIGENQESFGFEQQLIENVFLAGNAEVFFDDFTQIIGCNR